MPQLPSFANEQEAADWFATHDIAPFMDEPEVVTEPIRVVRTHPQGIGEQLLQEVPDLLDQNSTGR